MPPSTKLCPELVLDAIKLYPLLGLVPEFPSAKSIKHADVLPGIVPVGQPAEGDSKEVRLGAYEPNEV